MIFLIVNSMKNKYNSEVYFEVAKIHQACISGGFLSTLGLKFLALLYESIDADPNSALFIEFKDGKVVGFVSGGASGMGSIYKQMFKRWPKLLYFLLPSLLNLSKVRKILNIIFYERKQNKIFERPRSELFSIAVLDSVRGAGVSEHLYRNLKQFFFEKGQSSFCILVGDDLQIAKRFYERMGAAPKYKISLHENAISVLYLQSLI